MEARVHSTGLVDALLIGLTSVGPAGGEFHDRALVGHVTVDLVGAHEDERALGTVLPCGFEEIQRPVRVDLEVVERAGPRQIVRRLGGTVDEQVRAAGSHRGEEPGPVAHIELVMGEVPRHAPESSQVRRGVAVGAEEAAAQIVVDPVNLPSALREEGDGLRPDEPAAARDERPLHE